MTDPRTAGSSTVMSEDITKSFTSLWTRYAGVEPTDVRTELRGDVLTCVLVDAVDAFERRTTAPRPKDISRGQADPTLAGYKQEAVESVGRLTRQRVASFVSSHDRDTDVATETFTLEPPPRTRGNWRGRPASTAPPPRLAGAVASLALQPDAAGSWKVKM
jgi:hypothetical protein